MGCNASDDSKARAICNNQDEIYSIFKEVSIFRTNTNGNIFLYTTNGKEKNEYIFTRNHGRYKLYRDNMAFQPDSIIGINKDSINSRYLLCLDEKVSFYLRKMDSLGISDISSDFIKQGIDLKIYLKGQGVLVYVSDERKVINPEWKKYLNSLEHMNGRCYYSAKEK